VILVVEHQVSCPPAWFGDWLKRSGVTLDVRRPYQDDELPDTLRGLNGLLVLGGAMGAAETGKHPWLTPTKALIGLAAEGALPTLGICLGHQLVVSALGGTVVTNPRGREIGVRPVDWLPSACGDPLFAPVVHSPCVAVYWNHDVVSRVPDDAEVLARADTGEVQAMRVGERVWGVQFHPEVSPALARRWADEEDRAAGDEPNLDEVVESVRANESMLRGTWIELARSFAALVAA
jgi:GMP synthase (glutamine-hydrolysing)